MSTPLADGWSMTESSAGLKLERSTLPDRLTARRRLVTALGSAMAALALTFGGLDAPPGIGLIVWPLVGLFLLVTGLGFWAWQQARMAVASPLFLEVVPALRMVRGLQDEPSVPLQARFDDIDRVEVVKEPGLTVPVLSVCVITKSGLFFAGPELVLASDEAKALIPSMTAAAQALGTHIGCPVKSLD